MLMYFSRLNKSRHKLTKYNTLKYLFTYLFFKRKDFIFKIVGTYLLWRFGRNEKMDESDIYIEFINWVELINWEKISLSLWNYSATYLADTLYLEYFLF